MGAPAYCNAGNDTIAVNVTEQMAAVAALKTFIYAQLIPAVASVGIAGNVFNLLALRCPTLHTVPFMYIRSMAVFDLTGLILLFIASLRVGGLTPGYLWLVTYQVGCFILPFRTDATQCNDRIKVSATLLYLSKHKKIGLPSSQKRFNIMHKTKFLTLTVRASKQNKS